MIMTPAREYGVVRAYTMEDEKKKLFEKKERDVIKIAVESGQELFLISIPRAPGEVSMVLINLSTSARDLLKFFSSQPIQFPTSTFCSLRNNLCQPEHVRSKN